MFTRLDCFKLNFNLFEVKNYVAALSDFLYKSIMFVWSETHVGQCQNLEIATPTFHSRLEFKSVSVKFDLGIICII